MTLRSIICLRVALVALLCLAESRSEDDTMVGFFKRVRNDPGAWGSKCPNLLLHADREDGGEAGAENDADTIDNFYFMHIPKTAGTSFGGQLTQLVGSYSKKFEGGGVRLRHCYDSKNLLPKNDKCYDPSQNGVALFKAHTDINYAERLPPGTAVLTMLRKPSALTESRYLYQWRNAEPFPPPLAEWSKRPQNVRTVDNRQTRTLAGGLCCVSGKERVNLGRPDCGDSWESAIKSGASAVGSLSLRGAVPTSLSCPTDCSPNALLENAKIMLRDGVLFFGLVERYNQSLSLLAWKLGLDPPCLQAKQNTERHPEAKFSATPSEVAATIDSLNELDNQLYAYAEELFDAEWQALVDSTSADGSLERYLPQNLEPCAQVTRSRPPAKKPANGNRPSVQSSKLAALLRDAKARMSGKADKSRGRSDARADKARLARAKKVKGRGPSKIASKPEPRSPSGSKLGGASKFSGKFKPKLDAGFGDLSDTDQLRKVAQMASFNKKMRSVRTGD